MKPTYLTLRAVISEFARRIFLPVSITFAVALVLLNTLVLWLVTISAWWWILAIIVFVLSLVSVVLLIGTGIIIKVVRPHMSEFQRVAVRSFVDRIQSLSEITQTLKVVLLFHIIKDAFSQDKTAYIRTIIHNTNSVKTEFVRITESFRVV